jgi:hypothetical protein
MKKSLNGWKDSLVGNYVIISALTSWNPVGLLRPIMGQQTAAASIFGLNNFE